MTSSSSSAAPQSLLIGVYDTFWASVRSVGTAVTLAAVGVYLHRRGFVVGDGKRTLALLSQQVTFPLFLFTKIVYCNQDWSSEACPNITSSLHNVWFLLFWPLVVVGLGLVIGSVCVTMAGTPKHQRRACLAAIAFGNSSGLPITLLTVVHTNFPESSDLGRIDPTLFLSIYLLLYPVLQWGVGGWLLAPDIEQIEDTSETADEDANFLEASSQNHGAIVAAISPRMPSPYKFGVGNKSTNPSERSLSRTLSDAIGHNVFNHTPTENQHQQQQYEQSSERVISSLDEGNYISEMDLMQLGNAAEENERLLLQEYASSDHPDPVLETHVDYTHEPEAMATVTTTAVAYSDVSNGSSSVIQLHSRIATLKPRDAEAGRNLQNGEDQPLLDTTSRRLSKDRSLRRFDADTVCATIQNILRRSLQPPVIGSLLGIFVATVQPLRGIFVDLETRSSRAALQWFFDALYSVGLSAVPINMMILGCNISASRKSSDKMWTSDDDRIKAGLLTWKTMVWIIIGKMVLLPLVGISLCYCLKTYFWELPDDIDGAVYLVLMIVFLSPTANNVMVIVELGLSTGAKEGIAQAIALQYAIAPLLLSMTMTVAIGIASDWS